MTVAEAPVAAETLSPRKQAIRAHAERFAPERERWIERNAAYYAEEHRYMRFHVAQGLSVLEPGGGNGELLAALRPSRGVGSEFSATTGGRARAQRGRGAGRERGRQYGSRWGDAGEGNKNKKT